MKKKRLFIILGIVILLIIIIVLNLAFKEQGISVETKPAEFGSIVSKVSGDGQLKAEAQVNIQAQTMGTVEKLFVSEGGTVQKGQLVCILDQKSSKANLDLTQAQFEQAAQAFARIETLFAQNLISLENFETAQTAYRTTKARFEQAQDSYDKTMLTSPIFGTVTQLNIKQGEAVMIGTMNNPGTVLMVIANLSNMMGIIDLDETEVPLVKSNAKAIIRMDAFPDTTFSGTVSKVGYMPKQSVLSGVTQATDFEVEIKLDKTTPDLRPGMSINAEIITSEKDSILIIPIQSAGRRKLKGEETQTVFVVEKGVARLKAIKTGIASETDLEILDGIQAGDIVISGPYKVLAKLKDGDKVKYEPVKLNK